MKPQAAKPRYRFGIGPSGPGYVFVAGLILFGAIKTQENLLFWSFGLLIGGLLVSIVLPWMMMRHLDVQRLLPSHGVAGEPTYLRYTVHNGKPMIPVFGMVLQESWGPGRRGWKNAGPIAETPQRLRGRPHGWALHIAPHHAAQLEAPCWPLARGQLCFEKVVLSTSFPFGILRRSVEIDLPGQMLVYPHLYRINRRLLYRLSQSDPLGRKQLERAGGNEEFYGLRQYRIGDSMKMIDWKRSAKTGQLVAREMTQPTPPKILIILDLRTSQIPAGTDAEHLTQALDRSLSLCASLVCDAYFNGYQVGLAFQGVPGGAFPIHHSLPHRQRMLEALAELEVDHLSDEAGPVVGQPSVIVRPTGEECDGSGSQTMILSADSMHSYVAALEGGAAALLARRSPMSQRRAPRQEEEAAA